MSEKSSGGLNTPWGYPGNMNAYANPYGQNGMNPNCFGGMCNYNPWSSNM